MEVLEIQRNSDNIPRLSNIQASHISPSLAQFVSFMFLSGLRYFSISGRPALPSNYNPGGVKSLSLLAKL